MSSLVAFQGTPYIANYAATKAYDLILSESLATELSQSFNFKGIPITPTTAEHVATVGLNTLGRKRVVVPGAINKFLYATGKYLQPRKLNTFSFGKVFAHVLRKEL